VPPDFCVRTAVAVVACTVTYYEAIIGLIETPQLACVICIRWHLSLRGTAHRIAFGITCHSPELSVYIVDAAQER